MAALAVALGIGSLVAGAFSGSKDREQAKKAAEAQQAQNDKNELFLDKKTKEAGALTKGLFESASQNRLAGSKRALDILGQSIPQQLSTFRQGNLAAQEQLLAGLPQIQNALLGLPTDLSTLQPRQSTFDPSFTQQKLPFFQSPSAALAIAGAGQQPFGAPPVKPATTLNSFGFGGGRNTNSTLNPAAFAGF